MAIKRSRPPHVAPPDTDENPFLTSEDLFGEMVDTPAESNTRRGATSTGVRVRVPVPEVPVSEAEFVTDSPLPASSGASKGPQTPLANDEIAGLLDVLGASAPTGSRGSEHEHIPNIPSAPVGRGPASTQQPEAEFDLDLELEPPTAPGPDGQRVPILFQAATPKPLRGAALDLAAVAEDGMDEAVSDPSTAGTPASGSWRDDTYGPYQLLDRIAVGGMAEVFKAKRAGVEGFEKTVAVKRILPHLSDNKEFVEMFVNEAKMVAGLSHPNIVQIFDLGRIDKTYYIAMEYVHGRDLRTILRRAKERGLRLPIDLGLRIARAVAVALDYAHRRRDERGAPLEIVHRDVSPQNILISFEGDVKLVDFGIARAASKASNTDRGALRGKLLYMSPEQAWGQQIDQRSDIFSLGVVLYEMVTDERVFSAGSSELSTLELVRECLVRPPREVNPRVPEDVERVLLKALARDPDERYQSASDFDRALERLMLGRYALTGPELARLLEVLFEPEEREVPTTPPAWEPVRRRRISID